MLRLLSSFLLTAAILMAPARCSADLMLDILGGIAAFDSRDFMLGYDFTVNTPFTASGMGLFDVGSDGFAGSLQVGLWDPSGTLVRTANVSSASSPVASTETSGRWMFENITPITLTSGRWTVAYQRPGGSDPWQFFVSPSTIPNITFGDQLELETSAFVLPTTITGNGGHFGPNLLVVPEPASIVPLCLAGLAVMRGRRKR